MRRASIAVLVTLLLAACIGEEPSSNDLAAAELDNLDATALGELPPAATCPEGSNPDQLGPAEQDRPGEGGPMAFDRQSGRIVLLEDQPEPRTWTFDVCTNTWERMDPPVEPPTGVRKLVYDEDSDLTVALGGIASGWAYDVETDTWSERGAPVSIDGVQAAYDPMTGLVLVRNGWTGSMHSFDVETGRWEEVPQGALVPPSTDGPMHGQVMAYDPTIECLVLFVEGHRGSPTTWLFDPRAGVWTETEAKTPTIEFVWGDLVNGSEIVFDEAASRVVVISGGERHSFDGSTLRWNTEPIGMHRRIGVRLVYDAVNERLVLHGGRTWKGDRWQELRSVMAFEPFAGGWVELVPPIES